MMMMMMITPQVVFFFFLVTFSLNLITVFVVEYEDRPNRIKVYTNDDTLMDHSGGGGGFTLDLTLRIKQNEKKIDRLTFTFLFRFLSVCMSIISYRYLHLEPFIFMRKNYLLFKDIYQNVDDYDELFNGRLFSNNNQNNNIDI